MTAIDLQLVNGEALTLQVSKNNLDWVNVNPESTDLPNARYVRLINKTDAPVTFEITKFLVTVNAGDAAFEASVPEMSGYAPQNMFDSNEALSASITVAIFFKLSLFVSTNVSFGLLTLKSDIFNQTFLSLVFLTLT